MEDHSGHLVEISTLLSRLEHGPGTLWLWVFQRANSQLPYLSHVICYSQVLYVPPSMAIDSNAMLPPAPAKTSHRLGQKRSASLLEFVTYQHVSQ